MGWSLDHACMHAWINLCIKYCAQYITCMHMPIPKYWQTTEGIVLDFSLAISKAFSAAALGCLGTSSGVSVVSPASALATLAALLAALSRAAWAASETILLPFFGMRSTNGYEIHFTCKPFRQNILKNQLDKKKNKKYKNHQKSMVFGVYVVHA